MLLSTRSDTLQRMLKSLNLPSFNPAYVSIVIAIIALLVSVSGLLWQVSTQKKKVRQDLYEKRFNILQTILSCATQHASALASTSLEIPDKSTPMAKWNAELRMNGGLAEEQLRELFLAVQHIHYLYDTETGELANKLSSDLSETQRLIKERMIANNTKTALSEKYFEELKRNHDAVMHTANKLMARLSSELYLR